MGRTRLLFFTLSSIIQLSLSLTLSSITIAQDWSIRVKPRGTLKVVDLYQPSVSVMLNYVEGLVSTDRNNKAIPCLAKDWRWIDEETIEFQLREGVKFHNGERFDAEAVRVNWDAYRKMQNPRVISYTNLPDETQLQIVDDYTVRFTFPKPDGLAFVKFRWFFLLAPAFFAEHKVEEKNWVYLPDAGPWGTGPFKFVKGSQRYSTPSDRIILEANENYWDSEYPKVQSVIFENTLIRDRKFSMEQCVATEGVVDVVSHIRPLDTLKIAESSFAKVVKSRDILALAGWINQRKKDSKWEDVRLRQAINYAINREELWKYAAKGNAHNVGGFIPSEGYGHNPNLTIYKYDAAKARALLREAGYPEGFELKIISPEAWNLEAQIISRMLERVGFHVKLTVMTMPEWIRKTYIPLLDKPPSEQDWDIAMYCWFDLYAHTGASFLSLPFTENSDFRWVKYDSDYEEMWQNMAGTVDSTLQERRMREMVRYIYDRAYALYIYSPLSLYAVNKEVNFVPDKIRYLRLKETSVTENHWSIRGKNN